MTSKIEIWGQRGVIFDHFEDQKSRFLDFFKIVLVSFGKCLGFVFPIKMPPFVLFATRNRVSPLGSREALINVDKASPGLLVYLTCNNKFKRFSIKIRISC